MKTVLHFFCEAKKSEQGQAVLESPDRPKMADTVLEKLGPGWVKLTFEKIEDTKSGPQLGYFFAVVVPEIMAGIKELGNDSVLLPFCDHEGFLNGETYDARLNIDNVAVWLKLKFLPAIEVFEDGVLVGYRKPSIAKLSVSKMAEFIDSCIRFAAEDLGIQISETPAELARFQGLREA